MEQEIVRLTKQLADSSLPDRSILDLLRRLAALEGITVKLLKKTEVGLVVGRYRKHENQQVSDLARSLIRQWKRLLDTSIISTADTTASAETSRVTDNLSGPVAVTTIEKAEKSETIEETPSQIYSNKVVQKHSPRISTIEDKARTIKSDNVKIPSLADKLREKSVEMLYTALACNTDAANDLVLKIAIEIEETIYRQQVKTSNSGTDSYREKIRSLFLNLREKSNPNLRIRVLTGLLPVEKFCFMTSEQLKSKERLEEEQKLKEENLFLARGAAPQEAETDQFKCGKCKQRKCRYYQMQTRSADEPMTTFVTCANCGNKWKFC